MKRMKEEIRKLEDERAAVLEKIAEAQRNLFGLKGHLHGIDTAIAIVSGKEVATDDAESPRKERARGVKETVIATVQNAGPQGLTVQQLLDRTQREGISLERATVSSLLSRFKREGVMDMVDGRYFVPSPEQKAEQEARKNLFN